MKKVETYINAQFRKLPHTRTYREMKKNILLDCNDKYDEYVNLYGAGAEDKIIEEVGTARDLYHGGFMLSDWLNLSIIVFMIGYLLFTLFMRDMAVDAADNAFSVFAAVYGIPVYFILVLPKYIKGILISYVICNLMFTFHLLDIHKLTKIINHRIIELFTLILWGVLLILLIYFIIHKTFMIPHPFFMQYYLHGPFWQIFDIVYGVLLGYCTSFMLEKLKTKRLSEK